MDTILYYDNFEDDEAETRSLKIELANRVEKGVNVLGLFAHSIADL